MLLSHVCNEAAQTIGRAYMPESNKKYWYLVSFTSKDGNSDGRLDVSVDDKITRKNVDQVRDYVREFFDNQTIVITAFSLYEDD